MLIADLYLYVCTRVWLPEDSHTAAPTLSKIACGACTEEQQHAPRGKPDEHTVTVLLHLAVQCCLLLKCKCTTLCIRLRRQKRLHQHMLQDIGACFGQDTRQLLLDGWSAQELTAVDVVPDYWYLLAWQT